MADITANGYVSTHTHTLIAKYVVMADITENGYVSTHTYPDSKVRWVNMGPTWGRQDPDGSHVGPMNLAIWDN